MKAIFEGREYDVPDWVKYIARDHDNLVWAYGDVRPVFNENTGSWSNMSKLPGFIRALGSSKRPVGFAADSLVEVGVEKEVDKPETIWVLSSSTPIKGSRGISFYVEPVAYFKNKPTINALMLKNIPYSQVATLLDNGTVLVENNGTNQIFYDLEERVLE